MNGEAANEIKHKTGPVSARAWYCLHCQKKRESVAAAHLRALPEVEVFNPFLRFRRSTRRGPAWVSEAMFPSYLFARFELGASLARARHARGVSGVVRFGERYPVVPDETVADLRRLFVDAEIIEVPLRTETGAVVELAGGVFHGLEAVVRRVMPAQERIQVLMEFMGRQAVVEVGRQTVIARDARAFRLG